MKRFSVLLMVLVFVFILMGCKNDSAEGDFQNPYDAYGLKEREDSLEEALSKKPPKAIVFKPVALTAFTSEGEPLEMDEITLARGEKDTINLDIVKVISEDHIRKTTGYLTAQVEITYNPTKDGALFQVYNEVASKTVYKHVDMPEKVRGEKNYQAESIYQISKWGLSGVPDEEYLTFIMGQKGGAGNAGMILCRIVGVKR